MRKFRSVTSSVDANVYVGPFGEIVVDDSGKLRIQDNVTAGGHLLTNEVANTGNISFSNVTLSPMVGNVIYIDGDLIPTSNVASDLGSLDHQWRHLYVSSNTIYIGGTPLSVTNGELTVDGNPIIGGTTVPYLTVTNKAIIVPPIASNNETAFVAAENSGAVDDVDVGIGLSRGFGTNAKLFNVYSDYPSPVGTEWNSNGWADLTNLNLREYHTFSWATGFKIGQEVLTKNYIMRDVANNAYYKINFTVWQSGSNGIFSYVRQQVDPVTGADIGLPVTFEKTSNDGSFDAVSPQVHITRGGGGGIWNAVTETGWQDFYYNNRNIAPKGTAWNADGWSNLFDYKTREYLPFDDIYNNVNNIIGAELLMHDTVNNKYYKVNFSAWATNGNAFSYIRWLLSNPAIFVKEDYGNQTDVFIPDDGNGAGIGITRGNNNGIYNPYREGGWDNDISPAGTVWNIEGWDNLNNVTTRTYTNFFAAFGNGGLGNKVVGTECVMHIPENNTYYAIKFTSWTQNGNGGGFAYERYVIDTTKLPEGIAFPDGTVQKTAYNGGRIKSTASAGRRIEEVTGHNTVSVTARVTQPPASGTSFNTVNNDWYIFFNWDAALYNIYNGPGGYGFEISLDNNIWYPAQIVGSSGITWLQVYLLNDQRVSVNTGDTIYYRVSTGGDPVVWWDYTTLPGGSAGFRGAIIDYHAFSGEATIIGTIHIARDDGDEHITHTETTSGSTDSENDDLWNVVTEGQIRYRRMDGEAKTLKVHWIAKVFYGNEFWD